MTANLPPLNLIVQEGPDTGKVFVLQGQAQTIGRGSVNDIIIPHQSLSRQHAKIQATPNGFVIEDLGSTNGTFVNERQVQGRSPVQPGDTIRLGNVTFGLQSQAGAALDHGETMVAAAPAAISKPEATLATGKSRAAPDATVVPQAAPVPVQAQPKSSAGAWAWVGVAILIALLIVGGTLGYIYYTTQPPAAPVQEVAEATPTPAPTDTPPPSDTPPPEATATPEPIIVPGVAAASAQQQILSSDVVAVDPFCQTEIEVEASQAVALKWAQPLAPADADADYLDNWLNAAYYDLTLDGRPLNTFNYFEDEDGSLVLWRELGLLEPGTHFVRIQWFTNRQTSSGLDLDPADGQMDHFGPGPVGEGSCEIVVPEPVAAATATPTPEPTDEPTVTPSPSPTTAPATLSPPAPLGIFQDFERQSTWKRGDQPYGDFSRASTQVHSGSYAGQLNYNFPGPDNDYVVFEQSRRLAGRPNAISAWVYGDGAGHFLNVWIKDANGQSWAMSFGQVEHTGWQEMIAFLDPGQPWPSGHISGPDNGAIDYPISFQALVLDDGNDNFSGRGTIYIDDLNSQEGYTPPPPTSTPAPQVSVPGGGNQPGVGPAVSGGYMLQVGGQHKYTEPWGAPWDGDPCKAHRENNWNDKVRMRAFHLQLLLTNNASATVPGPWIPTYITANGKSDGFCYFGHAYTSVPPGGTSDITFFTVIDQGDYVKEVYLTANGQPLRLCLGPDGSGGACGGGQTGGQVVVAQPTSAPASGPYVLSLGGQHRYEEPWGAPIGNPCRAWENNEWDDKNANFRGFNVELIFANNSTTKVQDDWGESMRFITAGGQEVTACYYGYNGAGPAPGGSASLTFFSVVPRGDYVQTMQLNLNGQFAQLCLDGRGGWSRC